MTVRELQAALDALADQGHGQMEIELFGTGRLTKLFTISKTKRVILCDRDTEDSVGPNGEVIL
jgi:hypothetical protein